MQNYAPGTIVYEGIRRTDKPGDIAVIRTEYNRADHSEIKVENVKVTFLDPAPSRALWDHSADFEWGYWGSGPAQLALALLFDATGDRRLSLRYHQAFKEAFIATWPASWEIRADQIRRWVELKKNLGGDFEGKCLR